MWYYGKRPPTAPRRSSEEEAERLPEEHGQVLTDAGFSRRQGKGDHWVYTHARRPYPLTIDPRNPLLPAYVSKAISAIEEVMSDV